MDPATPTAITIQTFSSKASCGIIMMVKAGGGGTGAMSTAIEPTEHQQR